MSVRLPFVLVALLVGWLLLTSVGSRGEPWPVAGAVTLALVAYLLGRAVPLTVRPWAATAVGLLGLGAVLLGDGALDFVLSGPLGYANANAALAVQAGAAFALAASARPRALRAVGAAGALASLVVCLLIGAVAASAGAVLVLAAMSLPGLTGRRVSAVLSLAGMVAASLLPFMVGAIGGSEAVARALTERRVDLWSDGVDALTEEPLLGVGSRAFSTVSPTAAGDSDTREAHAELLQRAVENGAPGVLLEVLAVSVVAGALARRAWRRNATDRPQTGAMSDDRAALVGLAALSALWANAGVDWVLAFPVVVAACSVVTGLASSTLRRSAVGPNGQDGRQDLVTGLPARDSSLADDQFQAHRRRRDRGE